MGFPIFSNLKDYELFLTGLSADLGVSCFPTFDDTVEGLKKVINKIADSTIFPNDLIKFSNTTNTGEWKTFADVKEQAKDTNNDVLWYLADAAEEGKTSGLLSLLLYIKTILIYDD